MTQIEIINNDLPNEKMTFGEIIEKYGKIPDSFIETYKKKHYDELFPKKTLQENPQYPDWEDEIVHPDSLFLDHSPREASFMSAEQNFLMTAIRCNNYKAFHIALKEADIHHGRKNGPSPFILASVYAGKKIFSELLDKGAQPDVPAETLIQGDTGLHILAQFNLLKKTNQALPYAKNIDARNNLGWTALSKGAAHNSSETCELLLDKGADINAVTEFNRSPLLQSFLGTKDLGLPMRLVERNADTTIADNDGRNAFFYLTAWMRFFPQADMQFPDMGEKVMIIAEKLAEKGCPYQADTSGKKPLDYLWEQEGEKNLNLIQFFSKMDKSKPVLIERKTRHTQKKTHSRE